MRGAEVDRRAGAAALAAFRREQPLDGGARDDPPARGDGRALHRASAGARDFAAPPDEGLRQLPAARAATGWPGGPGRHARGAPQPRLRARPRCSRRWTPRAADGLDPVFLLTDAGDWPQYLYRRLGFEHVDRAVGVPQAAARRRHLHNQRDGLDARRSSWPGTRARFPAWCRTGARARCSPSRTWTARRCGARARAARCGSGAARARSCGTRGRPRATCSACAGCAGTATPTPCSRRWSRPGPACHTGERTCFHNGDTEPSPGEAIGHARADDRPSAPRRRPRTATPPGSWPTPGLRGEKVREEAEEVTRAAARGVGRARGRGGGRRALPPRRAAGGARPEPRRCVRGAE